MLYFTQNNMKKYIKVYTRNVWITFIFHMHNTDGWRWLQLHLGLCLHGVHVRRWVLHVQASALNTMNTWKDALGICKPKHPAAGQPYRKSRLDVPTSLSSPLELGHAPSATEQASSLHRFSEDGCRIAHPCIRGHSRQKSASSLS